MRLLLDTHAIIWAAAKPSKLSGPSRRAYTSKNNTLYMSHVTIWEMAIKTSLGKLRLGLPLHRFVERCLGEGGLFLLPLETNHILGVASLPFHHRDPFDRLLISQAMEEEMNVVTADSRFRDYGIPCIW